MMDALQKDATDQPTAKNVQINSKKFEPMRPVSPKVEKILENDDWMKLCVIRDGNCGGRITWEHCWIYSGRQIDEWWAIIPLCHFHHLGKGFSSKIKDYGRWVSLLRAKPEDLKKYPKKDWLQEKNQLTKKFIKI